jgi:hypothetical protein
MMNTIRYALQPLRDLFERLKAVTMPEMKSALATQVEQTVFRKLPQLSYRSSYSHRGGFYTLDSIARFDADGRWGGRGAWFSGQGTLLGTAQSLVSAAPAGYLAHELEARRHVSVKDALRQLVQEGHLARQPLGPLYLYTAADRVRGQEQWASRQAQVQARDPQEEPLRAALALFYSLLDEPQGRLYAGLASCKRGHGGDRQMAQCVGLDVETVARGRGELLAGAVERERIGRAGGGRPRAEKNAWPLATARPVAAGRYGGGSDGTPPPPDRQTTARDLCGTGPPGQ